MPLRISLKTIKSGNKVKQDMANVMYFEGDDEFTNFCVGPYAYIKRSENGTLYYEGDYSDEYKKCIKEGKTFIIKDENSQVYKRQCVTKRVPVLYNGTPVTSRKDVLVQLQVQGLQQYFDFEEI